jgi:hypothetical protein
MKIPIKCAKTQPTNTTKKTALKENMVEILNIQITEIKITTNTDITKMILLAEMNLKVIENIKKTI